MIRGPMQRRGAVGLGGVDVRLREKAAFNTLPLLLFSIIGKVSGRQSKNGNQHPQEKTRPFFC